MRTALRAVAQWTQFEGLLSSCAAGMKKQPTTLTSNELELAMSSWS
jgi:hypothetical protein